MTASGSRLLRVLACATAVLASAFTFLVQPVVGKLLVPQFGGGAGLWVTTMFFFQVALFGGYALAHVLRNLPLGRQGWIVAGLAVVALLTLNLLPATPAGLPPWGGILVVLSVGLLPAVLLSTSFGIVLQGWLSVVEGRVPYWIYSISNLGSLLALVAYPFVIEPRIGLQTQTVVLRAMVGVLALISVVCAVLIVRRHRDRRAAQELAESIPPARWAAWIGLSFLGCALMLSGTNLLQAEIGSNPLAWLIPLGLYLASFSLAFVERWPRGVRWGLALVLAVGLAGFMAERGVLHSALAGWPLVWLAVALAAGCVTGNRLLFELRPERRYSVFYLAVAGGGALGGIYCSLLAPNLFPRSFEFVGTAAVLTALSFGWCLARADRRVRWAIQAAAVAGVALWCGLQLRNEDRGMATKTLRNHYGTIVLRVQSDRVLLASETTLHGGQFLAPNLRRTPTLYYAEGSALGRCVRFLQAEKPGLKLGDVGLGVGTLAAYTRETDELVFWEINPLMLRVAADAFSFLREARGPTRVELDDGRLGLARWPGKFDLLLVDAFSGDAVPMHLMTREAFTAYLGHVPDGIVLLNLSNHYIDLLPVVVGHARALGREVIAVYSLPPEPIRVGGGFDAPARYAVVVPSGRVAAVRALFAAPAPDGTRYLVTSGGEIPSIDWTDDRHAIVEVLDFGTLFGVSGSGGAAQSHPSFGKTGR